VHTLLRTTELILLESLNFGALRLKYFRLSCKSFDKISIRLVNARIALVCISFFMNLMVSQLRSSWSHWGNRMSSRLLYIIRIQNQGKVALTSDVAR
jgi:hypothetical protein